MLSLDEAQRRVNQNPAITLFQYNALTNSIPRSWINWIGRGETAVGADVTVSDAHQFNAKPKIIKEYLQRKDCTDTVKPIAVEFWNRKLQFKIGKSTWLLPRKVTKEVRLRELHWKIVHNLYPTNILLQKMGKTNSANCSYCLDILDTMEHFFYDCPRSICLWEIVERKLGDTIQKQISLSRNEVIFGTFNDRFSKQELSLINNAVLIGKMCISKYKKCQMLTPIDIIFVLCE